MIDIKFKEKIDALKARFFDGDSSAKELISQWEADIQHLSMVSDFVQQPVVVTIVKVLKDRIKSILIDRATNGQSETLIAREKELRYILELFCPKYESQLDSLEKIIDNELL